MFKRIVIGILSLVMAACFLCGCSFVTFDTERDMRQKIAYIKPYEIYNSVVVDDDKTESRKYETKSKTIYKRDLVDYVNNNASNLSQSFGSDYEGMYTYAADMLINMELVINEVDALIECGNIVWTVKDDNIVKKNIYAVIDNTITSLKNTILSERDQEEVSVGEGEDIDTETTYPVKPEETDDAEPGDNEIVWEERPWSPNMSAYPGLSGDNETRSLEREAMRRFVALLESRVEDDFRITAEQREKFDKELDAIEKIVNTKGIEYVYPEIGTYPLSDNSDFGYLMYYISGESIERSQKLTVLREYLASDVNVTPEEVLKSFTATAREQATLYKSDIASYDTAMSEGKTTILYHPNNNYFYVKHILLPFSDAQTAALNAYKNRVDITSLEENEQERLIEAYRAKLAEAIVCYPHENGEDDKTRPMTVNDVMQHIRSVMLEKESSVASADTAFDDLIYLYNTDPGAFGNNKGYVVKYKLDDGEQETYMQEFADAARYMRDNLAVGQVYYEPVVTDFGVHIMYLASVVKPGEVSVYDYTTPGKLQTYYELLEQPIRTQRENAAYTRWEGNILAYNYKKYSELYKKNFSNLWGD